MSRRRSCATSAACRGTARTRSASCGRRGDRFVVNDPAVGERLLTREELDGSYTGVVLEIRPGEGFLRAGWRRGSLGLFLGQFASVWREAAFIVCLGFLLLPLTLLTPNLNKVFMDAVFVEGYRHWAWPVVILAALTLMATFALMALRSIAITDTFLRMSIGNTGRFLRHVIRLPAGFFASRLCGELVQRVSYVELAAQFTVQTLMVNFSDCVGILAFGALLFVYDVPLAILSLVSAASQRLFAADDAARFRDGGPGRDALLGDGPREPDDVRRDDSACGRHPRGGRRGHRGRHPRTPRRFRGDGEGRRGGVLGRRAAADGDRPRARHRSEGAGLGRGDECARRRDGAQGHPGACEAERDADEIIVLDGGTVVERGTHDELMAKNGVYAHLVRNEG